MKPTTNMKQFSKSVSSCCKALLSVASGDEGTSHYVCKYCGKPCDASPNFPASADEKPPPVEHSPANPESTLHGVVDNSGAAAGGELFAIPESKSPRLRWMERHGIRTHHAPHMEEPWTAWARENSENGLPIDPEECGYGMTEIDAMANLGKVINLKLWNEEAP